MTVFLINYMFELMPNYGMPADMSLDSVAEERDLNYLLYEDESQPDDELFAWLAENDITHQFRLETVQAKLTNEIYIRAVLDIPDDDDAFHCRMRFGFKLAREIKDESGFPYEGPTFDELKAKLQRACEEQEAAANAQPMTFSITLTFANFSSGTTTSSPADTDRVSDGDPAVTSRPEPCGNPG